MEIANELLLSKATFNLENVSLLTNPNLNPKNGVAYIKKCVCPKPTQRKQNQNKANEAKTVENIKYNSILSWSSGFIYGINQSSYQTHIAD